MPTTKKIKKETEVASVKAKTVKEKPVKTEKVSGAFAVIETGGKQYRVSVGESIKIEKFKDKEYKEGDTIVFDKVLLIDNGVDATDIGTPYLTGAKVSGTLIEIGRNPKVIVIKYKQKSRYFKKNGHRQPYFKVQINSIS